MPASVYADQAACLAEEMLRAAIRHPASSTALHQRWISWQAEPAQIGDGELRIQFNINLQSGSRLIAICYVQQSSGAPGDRLWEPVSCAYRTPGNPDIPNLSFNCAYVDDELELTVI